MPSGNHPSPIENRQKKQSSDSLVPKDPPDHELSPTASRPLLNRKSEPTPGLAFDIYP